MNAEPSYIWEGTPPLSPALFEFLPPGVPEGARPIHDEASDAIIGYQAGSSGVFRTYDLSGELQSIDELPLEAPLIDPLDAVFLAGTAWKLGSRLVRGAVLARAGVTVSQTVLFRLRAKFHALAQTKNFRFTAKALDRMREKGRFVPVHILRLAILHGKRMPDPRKEIGYFMYTIKVHFRGNPYTLEVLLNERDYIIAHFKYFD
ncbi:hypothetical protein [Achromobacter sp. NFACC18-2]|uniref:hypothetical protein n=1 Tax=Achromobacter sp. NFACC18-2 TaxID=1564112 RepID=UPI000AF8E69D|nr:hypothetical protein [Achromobacter sp. NFACC18-2]